MLPPLEQHAAVAFCASFLCMGVLVLCAQKPVTVGSVLLLTGMSSASAYLWTNAAAGVGDLPQSPPHASGSPPDAAEALRDLFARFAR